METVKQIEYNGALYDIQDAEAQKNLVYSQEETDTGKIWIDGKKIYRKIFLFGNIAKNTISDKSITDLNIDTKITMTGGVVFTTDAWHPLNYSDEQKAELNVYCGINDSALYLKTGNGREIKSAIVILEYTKTTN